MQYFNLLLTQDKCSISNKRILIPIPVPKLVIHHLESNATGAKGGLHQYIGAVAPNGWQKAIFYLCCKKLHFGSPFQLTLCRYSSVGAISVTDGSITHIEPERVRKIGFIKYIYFYLFKIQPFINFLSFFFLLLSLVILTSGAYTTCFFLIYPKASTIWIPHM